MKHIRVKNGLFVETETCLGHENTPQVLHSVFLIVYFCLKERSLISLKSSLESMKGTERSLRQEMGTELLAQLTIEDQREVDKLNDTIQQLTHENSIALKERIKVSSVTNSTISHIIFRNEASS